MPRIQPPSASSPEANPIILRNQSRRLLANGSDQLAELRGTMAFRGIVEGDRPNTSGHNRQRQHDAAETICASHVRIGWRAAS